MPKTEKERKSWAKKIQFYWTVLYTWYRFDYYENATFLGKVLHGIGTILHVPMRKAYKGYEKLCTRFKGKDTEYVCDTVFIRYLEKTPGSGSGSKKLFTCLLKTARYLFL